MCTKGSVGAVPSISICYLDIVVFWILGQHLSIKLSSHPFKCLNIYWPSYHVLSNCMRTQFSNHTYISDILFICHPVSFTYPIVLPHVLVSLFCSIWSIYLDWTSSFCICYNWRAFHIQPTPVCTNITIPIHPSPGWLQVSVSISGPTHTPYPLGLWMLLTCISNFNPQPYSQPHIISPHWVIPVTSPLELCLYTVDRGSVWGG